MMGPPRGPNYDKIKPEKPKNIRQVPHYVWEIVRGLARRLFYIVKLVWRSRPWILFVMCAYSVISGAVPVASAFVAKNVINELCKAATDAEKSGFDKILALLVLQFAIIFVTSLINSIYNMVIRLSGELVTNHIKLEILEKAKSTDIASFDRPDFYEKLENASREAGSRPVYILQSVFSVVSSVISLVSFIVILAGVSTAAPLLMIAFSVPSALVSFIYRKKNFEYMRRRSKDRRKMNYYSELITNKDMAKEIRVFGLADTLIDCYKDTFSKYFGGMRKLIIAENGWSAGASLVGSFINCFLFLTIAKMVWQGALTVGDYTLYTGALNSISQSVSALIATFAMVYEGTLFIDNMISFMDEKQLLVPTGDKVLRVEKGKAHRIEFKNVSFRYPGQEKYALKNINLAIEPGDTAVLVGLNGAGKTTLIKLMTRLYDPTEGEILLDGEDIRRYDTAELYSMYGIIFQDFGKYAFTAEDNIAFGDITKEKSREKVVSAAENSNAASFIEKLPEGYDTPLTRWFEDDGTELSVGQWQKLSVARAFYGERDFLILDEPTASLDAIAESEIFSQFEKLRCGKTTVFVSHRLSSATSATKIFVIDSGELIESGSHRELMEAGGKYFELFTTQAKRYVEGTADEENLKNAPWPHGMPSGTPPHGMPHGTPPQGDERSPKR